MADLSQQQSQAGGGEELAGDGRGAGMCVRGRDNSPPGNEADLTRNALAVQREGGVDGSQASANEQNTLAGETDGESTSEPRGSMPPADEVRRGESRERTGDR